MLTRSLAGLVIALALAGAATVRGDQNQAARERTPVFTCGEDQKLPAPIQLWWGNLVLAGDGRGYIPCPPRENDPPHTADHRELREIDLLGRASRSQDQELRWRAVQATIRFNSSTDKVARAGTAGAQLGSLTVDPRILAACNAEVQLFGNLRWHPGRLFFLLLSPNERIRKEGAYAIGVQLSKPGLEANLVTAATKEIRSCLQRPVDPGTAGLLLEAIGVARYANDDLIAEAEAFLVAEAQGPKILGAVRGLEALIRRNAQRTIGDGARQRLRQLAVYGVRSTEAPTFDVDARIRRVAWLALQAARDNDVPTLRDAAGDGDWQVRRLVAARLNLSDPEQAAIGELLVNDRFFQVRYELIAPLSREATRTGKCASLVEGFKDPSPHVAMRAMDMLVATCTDLEKPMEWLVEMAGKLAKAEEVLNWHLQSRALTALARVKPDLAKPLLEGTLKHEAWQVRAAAAATAGVLADAQVATTLAGDPEPNVRTAALEALYSMKSAEVVPQAIAAVKDGADYQLLRTAASVLRGLPEDDKPAANEALLNALARLTEQQTDTSRDPRVAIIERLAETLGPTRINDLIAYMIDYDDEVIAAARKAFESVVGVEPTQYSQRRRRYPYQPSEDALNRLASEATIHFETGDVVMKLLPDVAPVTVARFMTLVEEGFYKERTFHRIVPNFVVQGGSPGANEYAGTSRYMRDEVGPQGVHIRGAVGISTRGPDTGDGQLFIDLVDVPRLDRDYTVFAYVTQGMDLIDRLLEGAKIRNISFK